MAFLLDLRLYSPSSLDFESPYPLKIMLSWILKSSSHSPALTLTQPFSLPVRHIAFSSTGSAIAAGGDDSEVKIINSPFSTPSKYSVDHHL